MYGRSMLRPYTSQPVLEASHQFLRLACQIERIPDLSDVREHTREIVRVQRDDARAARQTGE